MTSALRRVLPEFDASPRLRAATPAWRLLDRSPPDRLVAESALASDPEPSPEVVAAAVATALADAEARHADALAAGETRAARDLEAARRRWAADEGEALAELLGKAVTTAADGIADALAALLEPRQVEAIRRDAVTELRGAVAELIAGGAGGRISASGPEDLLGALAAALAREGIAPESLDFRADDTLEVTIVADSSTVRTRLGDWMQALRRRLEGQA